MFKNIKSTSDFLIIGLIIALIVYAVCECTKTEQMDASYFKYLKEPTEQDENKRGIETSRVLHGNVKHTEGVNKAEGAKAPKCGNFVSSDLLPKNNDVVQDDKFKFAPNKDVKLLIKPTQSLIGVNTQGGSLRNPNLDIRSSPSIEKKDVSPWLNSTIGPDLFRRPLE